MSSEPETARVALVTGGSGGIGRDTALRLATDGLRVIVNYAGHVAEADAVVAEIAGDGGQAVAVKADVADETAVAAMFDTAEQAFGGIDVVVHAAGIMPLAPLAASRIRGMDFSPPSPGISRSSRTISTIT